MKYKCIVTCSWDDGHKLDLKLADFLLQFKLLGTFFIPSHYLDDPLLKEDIIFLSKYFEIGSHSLTHPYLTKIPLTDAQQEIAKSKKVLEDIIGRKVYGFSYPHGDLNKEIVKLVKNSGYAYARTNKSSMMVTDPYQMGVTVKFRPFSEIKEFLTSIVRMRHFTFRSLVKATFDSVYSTGGIWHMLGHSWQIEKIGIWNDLEETLSYISNKKDVLYATNYEVIQFLNLHS